VSLPVVFRELASDDVHDIHTWYEEQQPGLGDRFIAALDLVERLISEHPLSCPVTYRRTRRVLLPGFPYALFYLPLTDRVVVLACLHQHKEPRAIRKRLRAGASRLSAKPRETSRPRSGYVTPEYPGRTWRT
jgi:plasmid stabilization system protein ParE